MTRVVINDLTVNTVPFVHIEPANNKIYIVGFCKIEDDIQQTIYDNYNEGIGQDFFTDQEAASYLQIDNIKANLFPNTYNIELADKYIKASQLGCSGGNALFFAAESLIYTFDANNGVSANGSHMLQFWKIETGKRGILSLPTKFIFDKDDAIVTEASDFSHNILMHIVADIGVTNVNNALIVLHGHPDYEYVSNLPFVNTASTYSSFVDYLPIIEMACADANSSVSNTDFMTLTFEVKHANGQLMQQANTWINFQQDKGYLTQDHYRVANNSGVITALSLGAPTNDIMTVRASWDNYVNVASYGMLVKSGALQLSNVVTINATGITIFGHAIYPTVKYTVPGTYTFTASPYYTSLTVRVWGPGGQGANATTNGAIGTNSSFGSIVCTGGLGARAENSEDGRAAGGGGTATGGTINITGSPGLGPKGGQAPGPGGGLGGNPASPYGGGGDGVGDLAWAGGSGAYSEKTYGPGELVGDITVKVGAGGGTAAAGKGANGAHGAVLVEIQ